MSKLYLKTKISESGNLIFEKHRQGKRFLYCAIVGSTYVFRTKEEIIRDIDCYANVGISGKSIYPLKDKPVQIKGPTIALNPIEYILFKTAADVMKQDRSFSPINIVQDIDYIHQGRNVFFYVIRSAMSVYVDLVKLETVYTALRQNKNVDIRMLGWSDSDYKKPFVDLCYNALHLRGVYRSPKGVYATVEDMITGSEYSDEELSKKTTEQDAIMVVAERIRVSFEEYSKDLEKDLGELLENTKPFPYDMGKLLCDLRDVLVELRRMEYHIVAEHFNLDWKTLVRIIEIDKEHCRNMKKRKARLSESNKK